MRRSRSEFPTIRAPLSQVADHVTRGVNSYNYRGTASSAPISGDRDPGCGPKAPDDTRIRSGLSTAPNGCWRDWAPPRCGGKWSMPSVLDRYDAGRLGRAAHHDRSKLGGRGDSEAMRVRGFIGSGTLTDRDDGAVFRRPPPPTITARSGPEWSPSPNRRSVKDRGQIPNAVPQALSGVSGLRTAGSTGARVQARSG
jgi:hypothetical protein